MALSHPSIISGERLSFAKVCTTIQAGGLTLHYASESSGLGVGLGVGWVAYATHTPTHMGGHVDTLLFFTTRLNPLV